MVLVPHHAGISYRASAKQSGYIVQFGGRTVGGFHKTYSGALAALCAARRVSSSTQLPLKPQSRKSAGSKSAASKSEHLPYLFHCGKGWYSPQVPLGKIFPTAEAAMQAVKKSREGSLFLRRAKKTMQAEKKGSLAPSKLAHRIRCLAEFTLGDPEK